MLIDRNYVYVAPVDSKVVHRYRHAARDREDPADRLLLDYPAVDLAFAPDGRLLLVESRPGWTFRVAVYDVETLKRVPHPLADREVDSRYFLRTLWNELPDGRRLLDGVISEDRNGVVQCLTERPELPTALLPRPYSPPHRNEPGMIAWGRELRGIQLIGSRGASSGQLPHGVHELLKFAPIIVSLRQVSRPNEGPTSIELDLRDITTQQPIHTMTFSASEPDIIAFGMNTRITQTSDRVVIAHASTGLTLFRIPAEIRTKAKVPLHLKPPKLPVGKMSARLHFEVPAEGGENAKTFVLHNAAPGLTIDRRTGKVTIDAAEICRQVRTGDVELFGYLRSLARRQRTEAEEAEFRRVTGGELGKDQIPLAITTEVGVSDTEGASDKMTLFPIVTFSKEEFEALFPSPVSPSAPPVTALPSPSPSGSAPKTPPMPGREAADGERLRQLEERLRKTEAALEAVLKRIEVLKKRERIP